MGTNETKTEFEDFVRVRLAGWRRVAYLMSGDWDRGDDVVQQMLTELFRTWERARMADNLDGLARTILTRRLIDERRSRWARVRLWSEPPDRADVATRDSDTSLQLVGALRRLAARQRAVLVLRFFYDLTVEDTAATLACAPGTVKSQTAKGLATLRELLAVSANDA